MDLLSVGVLNPNDKLADDWQRRKVDTTKPIAIIRNLQCPVYATSADLNRDGREYVIICQFGHHLDKLT